MSDNRKEQFREIVNLVIESYSSGNSITKIDQGTRPDKATIIEIINKLQWIVFPGFYGKQNLQGQHVEYYVGEVLETISHLLCKQITRTLIHVDCNCCKTEVTDKAQRITFEFLSRIPMIREYLQTDVQAAFDGDPAAFSTDEVVFSYPGLYAIFVNRIAHELYLLGVPLIPRIMTEHAHSLTGIDLHPGATIGKFFFMDHGTGIVIGETTIIGNNVKIYQGVTLGALSTRGGQTLAGVKRHPTIEDDVTIYSGASILGGQTTIEKGVTIGSNAFVTKSVPSKTRVSIRNPELQFKGGKTTEEFEQDEFWFWTI